jgi:hypothetical protein
MEESKEQQNQHRFLQALIYLSVALDILVFVYGRSPLISRYPGLGVFISHVIRIKVYSRPLYCKLFSLILVCLVSVGTLSRKQKDLNPKISISYPLSFGLILFFGSIWFLEKPGPVIAFSTNWYGVGYILATLTGTVAIHVAMDNVSKIISSNLGKDKWNVEGESFMQPLKPGKGDYPINIPMQFYYKGKVRDGYIVIDNLFRACLLVGVPGSGKTFGVVNPYIRTLIGYSFSLCLYDFKYPSLGKVAYYHYLLAKQNGKCRDHDFHVINLTEVERSRWLNVLRRDYILTLADASETAEALVEALKKAINQVAVISSLRNQRSTSFRPASTFSASKKTGGIQVFRMCWPF